VGEGEKNDWATERLGEKAKPKANLPQHGHLQAVSQGYTGEVLERASRVSG